ncbi:hypothetical protein HJC23_003890 [Cyclotella cryptica]|uniref:Uncharacterized protein n=1 Tax=Cyclotella cryptica TaxID=29204 RepID=A0ABD3PQ37_9STRA
MSLPLFHSLPFNPRGGGGGGGQRNSDWYQSQLQQHPMGQYPPTNGGDNDAEWTTPTNLAFLQGENPPSGVPLDVTTPVDQGVTSTRGHGHSEDVYSQWRRGQRRRQI